jgi:hypothetical protein
MPWAVCSAAPSVTKLDTEIRRVSCVAGKAVASVGVLLPAWSGMPLLAQSGAS